MRTDDGDGKYVNIQVRRKGRVGGVGQPPLFGGKFYAFPM